ncbi:Crp/Fnr family transcriptional regulator [Virgibacillus halodenitrificans]|uniref:Crp/Fnr family transcriptional regulator n=1 Tax=Virgibacillus halodenitrificans TaxID=1482 RepID=UPI0002FFA92A|nr:Crp/Fnr family transcriptional regulator [Virgibacillus halodenitrificans]MYL47120.1 cyclic nucleotide-binding domain-containing protein [Virgibacillus halodenitrificans]
MSKFIDSSSPWFENLDYDWSILLNQAIIKYENQPANTPIYHQGDQAENIFIVLYGRIRLFMLTPDGKEKAISIAGKNCLLGVNRQPEDNTYFENAISASEAKVASLPYQQFENLIYQNPTLVKQYVHLLQEKLRLATTYNLQLSYGSSVKRIYDAFYHLAKTYGVQNTGGTVIQITFTHQELANLIGTSRVTVANTVNDMLKNNLLKKTKGKYLVPDLNRLITG